jgi:hypothetical protein
MLVTDLAFFIDQHQRRNAPQFEQVNFLSIKIGDNVLWVGQTNEGQAFNFPISHKGFGAIGADRQDNRVTRGEGRKIIAQTRKMGAAVRSKKPAQEDQDNVFLPRKLQKTHHVAI